MRDTVRIHLLWPVFLRNMYFHYKSQNKYSFIYELLLSYTSSSCTKRKKKKLHSTKKIQFSCIGMSKSHSQESGSNNTSCKIARAGMTSFPGCLTVWSKPQRNRWSAHWFCSIRILHTEWLKMASILIKSFCHE